MAGGRAMGNVILVIDDDDMTLSMAKLIIEKKLPCKVLVADNGVEGLEILRRQPISAVVLDAEMPFMDGFDVLKRIRADKKIRRVPVIMLSEEVYKEKILQAARQGVTAYVKKPFKPDEILKHVKKHISYLQVRLNVLVVDDDELDRQTAKGIIEESSLPCDVSLVDSGMAALEAIKSPPSPNIVLLDIDMEWMDGFRTADFMSNNDKMRDIHVCFMAENIQQERIIETIRYGFVDGYIKKPFVRADFVQKLTNITESIYHPIRRR